MFFGTLGSNQNRDCLKAFLMILLMKNLDSKGVNIDKNYEILQYNSI